jgi:two-component system, LuxR family, response regulator FixJ
MKAQTSPPTLIAIVDDEECMREALVSLLRSEGFAAEAFESAAALFASGRLVDVACLVLDVRMPGIDGLQLQRGLVATGNRFPIIFITAHAGEVARETALRLGAVDFLKKPFTDQALLEAVRRGLARSASSLSTVN